MTQPCAYLITFRTYGTWLHGDDRGSVDRMHSAFDTPFLPADPRECRAADHRMTQIAFCLDPRQRHAVRDTITRVCGHHGWELHSLHVGTNHVHACISASELPERVMLALKTWSTRRLRQEKLVTESRRIWSRHGSTKYLWKPEQVVDACRYVEANRVS